jgi:hypothetical protein
VAVLAACAVSAVACARPRPVPGPGASLPSEPEGFSLSLAGEFILPREARVANEPQAVGGISGLTPDTTSGVILGVSDARDRTRVYEFTLEGEGASFRVVPTQLIALGGRAPASPEPEPQTVDLEAIAVAPDGGLLLTSEGDGDRSPRLPTAVLAYDREGTFLGAHPVPPAFVTSPSGPIVVGTRRNTGFESLTVAPGGRTMFVGAESPLAQDDEPPTLERGARTRILEYRRGADGAWVPGRQFVYHLDAVAGGGFTPTLSINGLVELLAWSEDRLLAMERSYVEGDGRRRRNRIRIYEVSLVGADDVSGIPSLRSAPSVTPATKRFVLDLDDVRGLSPQLAGLDNFEGMTFGPRLADGSASLVLVSDDNFNATQQTAFLLFRIGRGGALP